MCSRFVFCSTHINRTHQDGWRGTDSDAEGVGFADESERGGGESDLAVNHGGLAAMSWKVVDLTANLGCKNAELRNHRAQRVVQRFWS